MIYRLLLAAAVLHVAEEYTRDWVGWMRTYGFVKSVTRKQFVVINALFLFLMLMSAFYGDRYPVFGLSTAALLFINAWFHIFPSIWLGKYTPGLVTAVLLYLPLPIWAYWRVWSAGHAWSVLQISFGLGMVWMSVPLVYQGLILLGQSSGKSKP